MPQKTYTHLSKLGRVPSAYDIASSKLLYYPQKGFAVRTPAGDWQRAASARVRLVADDWEDFSDPQEMTYAAYVKRRAAVERHLDEVHRFHEAKNFDAGLNPDWLTHLEHLIPVLRYPMHGLQMVAAQVGHLAPTSKLTILFALQTGDELRRLNRLAYRMGELRRLHPTFGDHARQHWQSDSAWQALRRVVERLLVTYVWDEAFVALNLLLKPALAEYLAGPVRAQAEAHGDSLLPAMLFSLAQDETWHRDWSESLARFAIERNAANADTIAAFRATWQAQIEAAIASLPR